MSRPDVAFVTKTYAPDLERCRLLCRSIRQFAPESSHWVIVDARDRAAFGELEGARTHIVTTEELLPRSLRRLDLPVLGRGKNIWLGRNARPLRGWLVQQMAKLAIAFTATEDVLIHADSDVVLVRPFREDVLRNDDGSLRLYCIPTAVHDGMTTHIRWHRVAEQLLGIELRPLPLPDFVGGLIPWRRETVLALLQHVEARSGQEWMAALARASEMSEYTLYGRFVEDVLGPAAGQKSSDVSLCRCYWGSEPLTRDELDAFIDGAAPDELAVMVSAKAGMDVADYADVIERRWTSREA
jgi:hypothetical protein